MPNYGTPINPENVPATKPAVLRSVALGFTTGAEAPQLPPGMSSRLSNFIVSNGGIFPRPGLQSLSTISTTVTRNPGWVGDVETVTGLVYPVMLASIHPAFYSKGSWSALSGVYGSATTPIGYSLNTLDTTEAFFDATQYYNPDSDDFELCFVQHRPVLPYTWNINNGVAEAIFSTLTGAPGAKFVAPFDNRLVFANILATSSLSTSAAPDTTAYPQRVQWSARGFPSVYTTPDGGAEDLVDARGPITRMVAERDRLLVFFEREVWYGTKISFPYNFQFQRLDGRVGTQNPWSVADTPWGTMFLGDDLNLWLIPTGGSPVMVGGGVGRFLMDNVSRAGGSYNLANGVYSQELSAYLLTFRSALGSEQGVAVRRDGDAWTYSPLSFDRPARWQIRRLGTTSNNTGTNSGAQGQLRRVLMVDGTSATTFNEHRNVLELTSYATNDLGTGIECKALLPIPNPNPRERLHVREVRVDYRSLSAASLFVGVTPDWGTTYPGSSTVALPAASHSTQIVVPLSANGVYPCVELRQSSSGHSFVIQGVTVEVGALGNG